ncbi:hypothetical protein QNH46_10375 [Paenibacillus woosongensis]|uniref:Fibronectin type-III domain-containing protein n=1 Tax=Paenibacillus woosongensis TaxID=307580 RepID=A0AA95KVB2_9BACL|nr:hypothetical protein [Paenibacillus woosongensis]WHX51008.1 hypothetical protein QNH46_10375 [Paenibacillus woosongensis]
MYTKKVKVSYFIITLALLLFILPNTVADAASKYKGGLLDGIPLQTGRTVGQPTGADITTITDDSTTTRTAQLTSGTLIWHNFSSPEEINSVILNRYSGTAAIEFYDANNNLLLSYVPVVNDGVVMLPSPVSNVSTVVLKMTSVGYITEWNVFKTPSTSPIVPAFSWTYGGNQVVELFWEDIGASSYNIKRATTPNGPYALLASNIIGTSYADRNVNNKTPYYYVISSVNPAGESADSPQKMVTPELNKYTGGLLDGITLDTGRIVGTPTGTERRVTDNNTGTRTAQLTSGTLFWHTFSSPQEVSAVILNRYSGTATIEFFDANNNLLLSYIPVVNDGVVMLPSPVSNVSTVVLKMTTVGYITEWNVFGTPYVAPVVPAIDWIYGGDKTVELFWGDTGASSYNIKRATSTGGPYALIASNVKGNSYIDRTVNNGTTYYYVVSAVNPAAESDNSAQKQITPKSTKYTGGLLDGRTLDTGRTVGTPTGTERRVTDNNTGTRTAQLTSGTLFWHTFSSPQEVSAVILNRYSGTATIEFFDANNNLLSTYVPSANDTVEALETPVSGVTTVVLKMTTVGYITEWNVFGSGIEVEVPVEELGLSATAGNSNVQLSWSAVSTATSYKIQRSTTSGGPYSVIDTVSSSTYSYTDHNVVNGTTYYYIVTAVDAAGDVATSNEASATPRGKVVPPIEENSGDRALLFIMLSTGEIKEYDLSMNEVNAFIQWYETRATGVGPITFAIDKHNNNKGPFTNRKDYIIYDKIITFEVNAYGNPNSASPTYPTSPLEH